MTRGKILSIRSNPKNKYLNNRILDKFDWFYMHKNGICMLYMHEYRIDEIKLDLYIPLPFEIS